VEISYTYISISLCRHLFSPSIKKYSRCEAWIEINWSLSDYVTVDLVTFWSPTLGCSRRSSMVTRAVNQNRNARWADSEERLFGLTLDLGQEARLTLAEVSGGTKTGNSTANRISFSLSLYLYLSLFSLSFSFSSFVWQPGLEPTIMFGHSFSRHAPEAPYSASDLSVGRCLIVY